MTTFTEQSDPFSRRAFLGGIAGCALLGTSGIASALTGDQAENHVKNAVGEINRIIASRRSEGAMLADFERVFAQYADVNIIALTTLGPARRQASQSQINAYVDAFKGYFTRKYGKRFNELVGGQITVQGSRAGNSYVEVASTANLRGQAPFAVNWQISDRSGSPKIINMLIEGVNTLSSERVEIGALLDRRGGDLDKLIADLRSLG